MSCQAFQRGDVVWHPAPFKRSPKERPFLILSDSSHPFYGDEYAVVGLTTKNRPTAVILDTQSWEVGAPRRDSFASPWYIFTIKYIDIIRPKGALTRQATDNVAHRVAKIVGAM